MLIKLSKNLDKVSLVIVTTYRQILSVLQLSCEREKAKDLQFCCVIPGVDLLEEIVVCTWQFLKKWRLFCVLGNKKQCKHINKWAKIIAIWVAVWSSLSLLHAALFFTPIYIYALSLNYKDSEFQTLFHTIWDAPHNSFTGSREIYRLEIRKILSLTCR